MAKDDIEHTRFPEQTSDWRERPVGTAEQHTLLFTMSAIALLVGIFIGAAWFGDETPIVHGNALSYLTNLFTEGMSIVLTVGLFGLFSEIRRVALLKKELIRSAGKKANMVSVNAVDDLRYYGWLEGEEGLLKGAMLPGANLQGANLKDTNLQSAMLWNANLQNANLQGANLQGTRLIHADLRGADLWNANLQDAHLGHAKLEKLDLRGADLRGSNLVKANLQEASLQDVCMQNADLRESCLRGADLRGAQLKNAKLVSADLEGANLGKANLEGADLAYARLQGAVFEVDKFGEKHPAIMPNGKLWYEGMDLGMFTRPKPPSFYGKPNGKNKA